MAGLTGGSTDDLVHPPASGTVLKPTTGTINVPRRSWP